VGEEQEDMEGDTKPGLSKEFKENKQYQKPEAEEGGVSFGECFRQILK